MITFYKGTGSLAMYPSNDRKSKDLRKLMFSFAKSTGEKAAGGRGSLIDRESTIIVGFEYLDLCRLRMWIFGALKGSTESISFHRDLGESEKRMMNASKGKTEGTYGFTVNVTKGEEKSSVSVYLDSNELYGMMQYVDRMINVVLDSEFVPYSTSEE